MSEITKFLWVIFFRNRIDPWLIKLPLPRLHPTLISGLTLLISFLFVIFWNKAPSWALFLLFIILILDWLDGAIARKYNFRKTKEEKRRGWTIDTIFDRLSEGIITSLFIWPWFYLFLLNCLLSPFSYFFKTSFILNLRLFLFLSILLIILINGF